MRLERAAGDQAFVVERPHLAGAELEHVEQDCVGMLPEDRRAWDRAAWRRAEVERVARGEIGADSRLLDPLEHRIGRRDPRILAHHLLEGLVGAPADAGALQRRRRIREITYGEPALEDRGDGAAPFVAIALAGEIESERTSRELERLAEPGRLLERLPLPARDRDEHQPPAILGREVATIGAEHVV